MITPPTPAELQLMKIFWAEEDELNGSVSDVTRCIAEIERLQGLVQKSAAEPEDKPAEQNHGFNFISI